MCISCLYIYVHMWRSDTNIETSVPAFHLMRQCLLFFHTPGYLTCGLWGNSLVSPSHPKAGVLELQIRATTSNFA